MRTLTLLRHSYSENNSQMIDKNRILSEEGRLQAFHRAHHFMKQEKLIPDFILCSDSERTKETLKIFLEVWEKNIPILYTENLYNSSIESYIQELNKIELLYENILLVGHNPTISELAFLLDSSIHSFQPCEYKIFKMNEENWNRLKLIS